MKKFNARKLCVLGMLTALTVLLGFFATWRIGASIKISLKFSSVYVSAVLFGPLLGGFVGAASDIASFIANPVAGFIPLVTLAEFADGSVFGIFFRKTVFKTPKIARTLACCAVQAIFTDALLKTFALAASFGSGFSAMLISRLPAVGINFAIRVVIISVLNLYMEKFKLICYK